MVKNRVSSSFAEVKFMNMGLHPYRKGSGRVCSKLSREIPLGGGTNRNIYFSSSHLSLSLFTNCIELNNEVINCLAAGGDR